MKTWIAAVIAFLSLTLVGCGKNSDSSHNSATGGSTAATNSTDSDTDANTGDMTAKQVAEQSRGNVACPAKITNVNQPADAPVDDVVGVSPRLTYEQAKNVVLCNNPLLVVEPNTSRGFDLKLHGAKVRQGFDAVFAEPKKQMTASEYRRMISQSDYMNSYSSKNELKPGHVKYYVATMGMPGKERVIYAAREQRFAKGHEPLISDVSNALLKKYGKPTSKSATGDEIRWAYDSRGRYISERSPRFNECTGIADPDASLQLHPDCGIVISASLGSVSDNRDLAKYIQVGVVDHAYAYNALQKTQAGLNEANELRKERERKNAAKNADIPKM